jgi:hypothetical protein
MIAETPATLLIPNPIRTEFGAHGHWLRQIWRQGDVALYERALSKDKPAHELELVVIKIAKEKLMPNGKLVAAHEVYPSDSDWGRSGWSFPIAMKTFVLGLARHAAAMRANRAGLMRSAVSRERRPGT